MHTLSRLLKLMPHKAPRSSKQLLRTRAFRPIQSKTRILRLKKQHRKVAKEITASGLDQEPKTLQIEK